MQGDLQAGTGPVLVTGSNGIVGRAVLAKLARAGIAALPVLRPQAHRSAGMVAIDLSDASADLLDVVTTPPRAIVHLAAAVPHATEFPDTEASAGMTRRMDRAIATAAATWRIPVVYASTCGLYDPLSQDWKGERAACKVRSPYFAAKLDGERRLIDEVNATVLRLSAVYGPGMRNTVVMSKFIENIRAGRPIKLWGTGQREQDFIHADDVASSVMAALACPGSGIINIASGRPTTMRQLAEAVVAALGRGHIEVVAQPDPKDGETARYSIERAELSLRWKPRVALVEGVGTLASESFRP